MKTVEEKEKFILLRGQGLSFDKISQDLGISKNTLLKWEADNRLAVREAKSLEVQSLIDKHNLMRLSRLEVFASSLRSALEELSNRKESLSNMPTDKLLSYALLLERRLANELTYEVLAGYEVMLEKDRSYDMELD